MKPSLIALAAAAALALAASGYALGATQHDGAAERSPTCRQAEHEFGIRVDQMHRQMRLESHAEEIDPHQSAIDASRAKILSVIVEQNRSCFGAGTRAAAAVLRERLPEGEADAALCDLTGTEPRDCSVSAG